jgi:hypothetical protein
VLTAQCLSLLTAQDAGEPAHIIAGKTSRSISGGPWVGLLHGARAAAEQAAGQDTSELLRRREHGGSSHTVTVIW